MRQLPILCASPYHASLRCSISSKIVPALINSSILRLLTLSRFYILADILSVSTNDARFDPAFKTFHSFQKHGTIYFIYVYNTYFSFHYYSQEPYLRLVQQTTFYYCLSYLINNFLSNIFTLKYTIHILSFCLRCSDLYFTNVFTRVFKLHP